MEEDFEKELRDRLGVLRKTRLKYGKHPKREYCPVASWVFPISVYPDHKGIYIYIYVYIAHPPPPHDTH